MPKTVSTTLPLDGGLGSTRARSKHRRRSGAKAAAIASIPFVILGAAAAPSADASSPPLHHGRGRLHHLVPSRQLARTAPQPSVSVDAIMLAAALERLPATRPPAAPRHKPKPKAKPKAKAVTSARMGNFVVTCYDLGGRTASGATTSSATVAVDPAVIPLGSRIYISGVGTRVAQDTGGAIVGNRLDIWEPTYDACMEWGVRDESVYRAS